MKVNFGVIGVPQVQATLVRTAAKGEIAIRAGKTLLGRDIVIAAKARAPVDTGHLRDSIYNTEDAVIVGARYGLFVEYGTTRNRGMDAQPFLRPALAAVRPRKTEHAMLEVMDRA